MIALGESVRIVGGDLYLGMLIPAGTVGKVVGRVASRHTSCGYLYYVVIDAKTYTMAPDEIEKLAPSDKEDSDGQS